MSDLIGRVLWCLLAANAIFIPANIVSGVVTGRWLLVSIAIAGNVLAVLVLTPRVYPGTIGRVLCWLAGDRKWLARMHDWETVFTTHRGYWKPNHKECRRPGCGARREG